MYPLMPLDLVRNGAHTSLFDPIIKRLSYVQVHVNGGRAPQDQQCGLHCFVITMVGLSRTRPHTIDTCLSDLRHVHRRRIIPHRKPLSPDILRD